MQTSPQVDVTISLASTTIRPSCALCETEVASTTGASVRCRRSERFPLKKFSRSSGTYVAFFLSFKHLSKKGNP
jgi:hypothetical protein